ncbi:MAG: branched-chain amino acid aminotransferase [Pelagibacteraceae bacterium]|jgi:branched-chain amino acid aminotransferase|nr:branched-chain amino acid aminotransferase [Pelagibacteraceae bacterium]MBO6468553.1 branched-chain amino acid aminotransferase [Pelagibacteraceae bacterium]MBO6470487.1 branched-chain amino acid aminotransferase [Pelagibacteraceae bacterium]MBO6471327.1 branched-chain amino acid aminotransferase [Pelagibacteraceae bacterium]MDP6784274.1 branched-chain amino acid aminotransferase [Alphaproteobacteria bacterium]
MAKSFDNREGWIWMNGSFIPWKEATSHIINQGLHYASAVFEGERAYNGKIFKSKEHTERLFNSAEIMGIKIPFSHKQINNAKNDLLLKMNLKNCYVRPIVWRGSNQMGLSTSNADIFVAIAVWDDWHSYFKTEKRLEGLKLITSPWKRPSPETAPCNAKASGPYIICTMSKEFAEKKGYDDALMLDYRNYVAEGTGANIFFIKGNDIHTPIADCFLNGITRQTVIEMVKKQGLNLVEKHILPNEIENYDEALLTGTAAEITPIKSIDDINYNTGKNTTSYKLMNDFTDLVNSSI